MNHITGTHVKTWICRRGVPWMPYNVLVFTNGLQCMRPDSEGEEALATCKVNATNLSKDTKHHGSSQTIWLGHGHLDITAHNQPLNKASSGCFTKRRRK